VYAEFRKVISNCILSMPAIGSYNLSHSQISRIIDLPGGGALHLLYSQKATYQALNGSSQDSLGRTLLEQTINTPVIQPLAPVRRELSSRINHWLSCPLFPAISRMLLLRLDG
jgi:hypothetical protein